MPKWCDDGENMVADTIFGTLSPVDPLYIGLYENGTEPAEDDGLSDLTEQSGDGYARIQLDRGSWTITDDTAEYAQVTFTAAGAAWGNQYGYFITDAASGTTGRLVAVEHFSDGPYNVGDGDSVKITPKVTVS